jgi:hypothetical protein
MKKTEHQTAVKLEPIDSTAQLLLTLLLENRFPRIWVSSPENRDLRQLLWHRHRLVQMRTRIMESAASGGHERRQALEEKGVERTGMSTAREAPVRSLGQPASERVAGVTQPL